MLEDNTYIRTPAVVDVESDATAFCFVGELRVAIRAEEMEAFQVKRAVRDTRAQPRLREAQNTRRGKVLVTSHQQR